MKGRLAEPGRKSVRCTECGNDNREGRKFCVQCGQPLKLACPSCGASSEPGESHASLERAARLPLRNSTINYKGKEVATIVRAARPDTKLMEQ
jgi:predicted amidophosphoribosyltransferase